MTLRNFTISPYPFLGNSLWNCLANINKRHLNLSKPFKINKPSDDVSALSRRSIGLGFYPEIVSPKHPGDRTRGDGGCFWEPRAVYHQGLGQSGESWSGETNDLLQIFSGEIRGFISPPSAPLRNLTLFEQCP